MYYSVVYGIVMYCNVVQCNATECNAMQRNAMQCMCVHTGVHTYIMYVYVYMARSKIGASYLPINQVR